MVTGGFTGCGVFYTRGNIKGVLRGVEDRSWVTLDFWGVEREGRGGGRDHLAFTERRVKRERECVYM